MKRWAAVLWTAAVLLAGLHPLPADTLQDIDEAVAQLGAFVRRTVPDQEGVNIAVLPFSSDKLGRILLGDRIRSELELNLAASYSRTRVVNRPEGQSTYSVEGEVQAYPGTVRIICRVTRPDGSLGGGSRADIPASPELESLLQPVPVGRSSRPPERAGDQGLQEGPDGLGRGIPTPEDDPFEPDDVQGFELQVPEGEIRIYTRAITPGDIDRFRFFVPDEMTVVLEAQTTIDVQLLLFRDGENVPFEVGGSRGDEALRLAVNLTEGYYIVEVLAYDFNVIGPYSLAIDLTGRSNDGYEPDDLQENARQIFPGERQERALLPGDEDWVELSFTVPGFYAVHTEGLQTDTRIEVYEEGGRTVAADDDSGVATNAYVGLFLGVRRAYARITGKGNLDTGSYLLVFEKIAPLQVYSAAQAQSFPVQAQPTLLQLRILQSGRYLVQAVPDSRPAAERTGSEALMLFALPAMRKLAGQESLFALSSGDYLISVSLDEYGADSFALCVVPEAQAETCRRSLGGGTFGSTDR
jgi:hypothetical protein